jgi:hypothetical protein
MSYSRFSWAYFYTYWSAYPFYDMPIGQKKEYQMFEIHAVASFKYKNLKNHLRKCLKIVRERCSTWRIKPTENDMRILRRCIRYFLSDVNNHFKNKDVK